MFFKKLVFISFTLFTLLACSEKKDMSVGIIQTSDHEALDSARLGVIKALENQGFTANNTCIIKWESAQGNAATASQIAQKFVGKSYDVIVTIGTLASQSALQVTQQTAQNGSINVPIIYTSVTDPKNAKLQGNISGVNDFIAPKVQFETFKAVLPGLQKIGIIYSAGEQNSIVLNEAMKKEASNFGITLVFANATKTSDVYGAAMSLVGKVDALFVNNDNIALAAFDAILKVGREHKIPVFVSDTELVEKGALAAVGADQFAIGLKAGEMVGSLLKRDADKRTAATIPATGPDKPELYLNKKTADTLGIPLSAAILKKAAKVYE